MSPATTAIAINVGDWNYIEITAGDPKNDVVNRLIGIPPDD